MTDKLLRAPGALQPADVYVPSEKKWTSGKSLTQELYDNITQITLDHLEGDMRQMVEPRAASPIMKSLGYTRHPMDCHHRRMKYTESAMRWRCADCGEWGIF